MSYNVMISYSSKDGEFAENIYSHLINNGVNTFYAPRSIKVGETWPAKIGKAMEECSLAVLIFSKNANDSEQVGRELITLKDHLKKRILVINKDNTPPTGTFIYYLPSLHQIFYKSDEETLPIVFSSIKEFLSQSADDNVLPQAETYKKSAIELPPLATEFNKDEQKYINKLRQALEDRQISDIEIKSLANAARLLQIAPDRAKELEEQVKRELGMPEQALVLQKEQTYLNELRQIYEDKQRPDIEIEIAEAAELLDIPPPRAKELEEQVKKELGIVELTPVQEGTAAEIIAEEGSERDIAEHFVDDLNKKYESHLKAIDSKFELDPNGLKIMLDYSVGYSCKFVFEFQKEFMNCSLWDWCRNDYPIAGSKDFFGAWFDNECANDFPNYEWNKRRLYGYLVFWREDFPTGIPEAQLFNNFKKKVLTTLDGLFPKLEKKYNDSVGVMATIQKLKDFIDYLVEALKKECPAEEGWIIDQGAWYANILVYKSAWNGKVSFRMEPSSNHFDNLSFGFVRGEANYCLPGDLNNTLTKQLEGLWGAGITNDWWFYYRAFDEKYRYTGGLEFSLSQEQQNEFIAHYVDVFKKMKEVAPFIDDALSNTERISFPPASEEPSTETSLESGAQAAPEDPETESKVRGMVESILNDLTSKYADYLTKLNTSFQNWGGSSVAINMPLAKTICLSFSYKHSDDLIFLFTSGQKKYTLAWFNGNLTNKFPEPYYWEGDSDPVFWEIKLKKDESWESREQIFKNKIIESLDVILPQAVSSMEFLNGIAVFIDDIVAELSKVFPAEEGWECSQNAKSLERSSGIFFYKTNWKQDGLERGVISYSIECDSSGFDNLYWGIVKGSDKYTIELTKEELLLNKMTELLGGGRKEPWHPYFKYFDKHIKGLMDDKEGFLTLIKDIFSKMKKDVTPLVDDIITTGSITKNE